MIFKYEGSKSLSLSVLNRPRCNALKLQKAVNLECLHKIIGTSCKVSDILGLPEEEMYLCHWKFLGASEKQLSGRLLILLSSWAEEPTRLDGFLSYCKGAQKYPMLFWKGKKKHPHTAPRYCGSNASLWICNRTRLADDILIWKLTALAALIQIIVKLQWSAWN